MTAPPALDGGPSSHPPGTLLLLDALGIDSSRAFSALVIGLGAAAVPLTYAVSLLRGIWHGEGWLTHAGDVGALLLVLVVAGLFSARFFRWE